MFKLIAVALAALFVVFQVFGDESRRVDQVARATTGDEMSFSFADFVNPGDVAAKPLKESAVSDAEAIRLAIEAGVAVRSERKGEALLGRSSNNPVLAAQVEAAPAQDMWYVTGAKVNLRAGPGTSNSVVAQLKLGAEAHLLESRNGWHQIRTADGAVSGWIFGKFLADQLPG